MCRLYADALRRSPDPGGQAYWARRLTTGTSRATVARRFLLEREALRVVADRPHVHYLERHGTPAELQLWADRYQAGTATAQDTRIAVLASASYWGASGDSATVFVQHLYRDVFRRTGDAGGVAYWAAKVVDGVPRATVARRFVAEAEGRRKIVGDLYVRFLRREPTMTEATSWVQKTSAGTTEVDIAIALTSSTEYATRT